MVYIIQLFILKCIIAKLYPWEVKLHISSAHSALTSSPARQSVMHHWPSDQPTVR